MAFPYLARTTLKYKSPHATDLSFAKGDTIKVTGPSPDDEDWLVGETLDGGRSGGFPKDFIEPLEEEPVDESTAAPLAGGSAPEPAVAEQEALPEKATAPPSPVLDTMTLPPSKESPQEGASSPVVAAAAASAPSPSAVKPTPEPTSVPRPAPAAPKAEPVAPTSPAQAPASAPAAAADDGTGDSPSRPQTMKERLAFFAAAQNKPAPPPPVKPKPAAGGLTWSQRQKLRQEQEAKEREAAGGDSAAAGAAVPATETAPAAAAAAAAPIRSEVARTASGEEKKREEESKGMSAADALSSITKGGSLKERMAALQGSGAFGGGDHVEAKAASPASSGKVWKRPAAPAPAPAPEPESEAEGEGDAGKGVVADKTKSPVGESADPRAAAAAGEGAEPAAGEEDEEAQEKARRAAIAARMAKLGARGPMGMMPPAKPPARKPTREVESSPTEEKNEASASAGAPLGEAEGKSEEPAQVAAVRTAAISAGTTPSTDSKEPEEAAAAAPKSIPIPAVPRRAAPPRRRTPAPSSATSPSETAPPVPPALLAEPSVPTTSAVAAEPQSDRFETLDAEGHPVPPRQVMVAGEEVPLPKSEKQKAEERQQEEMGRGAHGREGAEAAGIALSSVEGGEASAEEETHREPLVGAVAAGGATRDGPGEIISSRPAAATATEEVEDSLPSGGDEKDRSMVHAQGGSLALDERPSTATTAPAAGAGAGEQTVSSLESAKSPAPIGTVPLHAPAPGPAFDQDEAGAADAPAPPPRRRRMTIEDMPLDEVERKHLREHAHDTAEQPAEQGSGADGEEEADVNDAPPSLPRKSVDRPTGPRPLPSAPAAAAPAAAAVAAAVAVPVGIGAGAVAAGHHHARALPPPPAGAVPPRDEDEEDREAEGRGDEAVEAVPEAESEPEPEPEPEPEADEVAEEEVVADEEEDVPPVPPVPPATRKETLPEPTTFTETPTRSRTLASPPLSPTVGSTGSPAPGAAGAAGAAGAVAAAGAAGAAGATGAGLSSPGQDDESSRRSGIAARMAKLGGIKFGVPPPHPGQKVPAVHAAERERSLQGPSSPIDHEPPIASAMAEDGGLAGDKVGAGAGEGAGGVSGGGDDDGEETPEQESARRRATLARLRAGGALGFGMFNQGPPPAEEAPAREAGEDGVGGEDSGEASGKDGDEAPPPPPPAARPTVITALETDAPAAPAARPPPGVSARAASPGSSPRRSLSGVRPPVPSTEKRHSLNVQRGASGGGGGAPLVPHEVSIAEEPRQMQLQPQAEPQYQPQHLPEPEPQHEAEAEPEDDARPPPPPPMRIGHAAGVYAEPARRSTSSARVSRQSTEGPPPVGGSARQGTRPGYEQLRDASASYGAGLARAAQGMFAQGKRAYYGDGSPAGFVLVAMDSAQIARPAAGAEGGWGQVVFEQEAGSILRRYDEPRAGDIAAFHDAKLKGKKGLSTYSQHVGSVEEPLVAVVVEFEERKHKLRVLQVERGVPEEVSYRCGDLKSGKVLVYRPGL